MRYFTAELNTKISSEMLKIDFLFIVGYPTNHSANRSRNQGYNDIGIFVTY